MQQKTHGVDGSPSKDFLHMNKSLVVQWEQYLKAKKAHAKDEFKGKMENASQRKDQLDEDRRNKNMFQLLKWDIVR